MFKLNNKKAFTIIELIVVMAVIGILVLLAMPKFMGHTKQAKFTKLISNAKQLETASERYYMDKNDWPRLTDVPYTADQISAYAQKVYDSTGKTITLDPTGNYYDIDYNKINNYIQIPDDKMEYVIQNPVGNVYALTGLSDIATNRLKNPITKIGQQLLNPEVGWRRLQDTDSRINYTNLTINPHPAWNGGTSLISSINNNIQWSFNFKFIGTKFRLLGALAPNRPVAVNVKIDGILQPQFSIYNPTNIYTSIMYEKTNLSPGIHYIEVYREPTAYSEFDIDAIDINDTGDLVAQVGQKLVSPELSWKRIDNTDSRINFIGSSWMTQSMTQYYGGSVEYSTSGVSTYNFNFNGTKLRLLGVTNSMYSSTINITIDGISSTFSEYSAIGDTPIILFEKTNLTLGLHRVSITDNSGKYISLDAIDVDDTGDLAVQVGQKLTSPEIGWKRVDNTDSKIKFIGSWLSESNPGYSGGSVKFTNATGSNYNFKFNGTKLRLLGVTNSIYSSTINVTVDGITSTFSEYSSVGIAPVILFEKTNLTLGLHSVSVTDNTGKYISLDAIDIDDIGDLTN